MERDELIEKFSKHEVETTEELLDCMAGARTTDKFRRLLLLFLRGHYSNPANYMDFDWLDCYYWHPDEAERRLEIEFTHQDDDRKPDSYPGIYVGFARTSLERLGIGGNFAGNTQDRAGTHISKMATPAFLLHHVAKKASDAFDLAELTTRALTAMAAPLMKNAGADAFEVDGFASPKEKNPSPEKYYTVAVGVQIKYTLAVTRSLESHRIRLIAQELETES